MEYSVSGTWLDTANYCCGYGSCEINFIVRAARVKAGGRVTMRVFLALDLPAHLVDALRDISQELAADTPQGAVRWVKPESIHLTLKFLGEVKPDFIDQVVEVVTPIASETEPMSMSVAGFGVFPRPSRPRVLWVGVQERTGALERLRNMLEAAFEPYGFERERRDYTPHLTLGRLKRGIGRRQKEELIDVIQDFQVGTLGQMEISELTLFESKLGPGGASYRSLHRFQFAAES